MNTKKIKTLITKVIISLLLIVSFNANADDEILRKRYDKKGTLSIILENDLFAGRDDGYTNGFRLSYLSPESEIPRWIDKTTDYLPFFSKEGRTRYGLALGQSMFSPDDITISPLVINDRPYAGFLFGSVGLLTDTGYRLDNLQLTLGIVGPSSLAAQAQDFVHHVKGASDPQGWDNQLKDEPGFILTYERKWRGIYELNPFGWAVDVTPQLGASIGNVYTNISTGITFRLGYDLPADYGPPLIRPSLPGSDFFVPTKKFGWYMFAGVEGRAVARDIFLDGNTFKNSHSVDKNIFVGGVQGGLAFTFGNNRLAYTHIIRTEQFKEQSEGEEFGAIIYSRKF